MVEREGDLEGRDRLSSAVSAELLSPPMSSVISSPLVVG